MRIFKLIKRYPSLDKSFQEGDIFYYFPMQDGEYSVKNNTQSFPAQYFVYKKLFHQQNDPFIWREHVENNPEFFREVENLYITEDPISDNVEERMDQIRKIYDNKVNNIIGRILR